MTRVLIIGGGGMVGQKLAARLAADGLADGSAPQVTLFDMGFAEGGAPAGSSIIGNLTDRAALKALMAAKPDIIYHLAAIVSGEAESNFDLGWDVNFQSFWNFCQAIRDEHLASDSTWVPRVVFTSSIAVFGPPFPDKIGDEFLCAPQTSYGAQKAASELMISDISRKGYCDAIAMRLPTICVRPGKANLAASSFFSGIIREPLNGKEAILPVSKDVRHWHASPRAAAGFLRHASGLDFAQLDGRHALNLPGVSCTVEEQIEALRDIAGNEVVALIKPQPDATIARIVSGWPRDFDPVRGRALGFTAEPDFKTIIQTYIDDDLGRS